MGNKKSIRFFNDREVRAVWSNTDNRWYFSATDVVRAINNEPDYTKAGNYWRWLKKKLLNEGIQLVSNTHDFNFEAPDGKMRKADVLDAEGVQIMVKHYPNNKAIDFLDFIRKSSFAEKLVDILYIIYFCLRLNSHNSRELMMFCQST